MTIGRVAEDEVIGALGPREIIRVARDALDVHRCELAEFGSNVAAAT